MVDTQILIWAANADPQLPVQARETLNSNENKLWFSTLSLWEVALKRSKNRSDFQWDTGPLRQGLLENNYEELPLYGEHVLAFAAAAPSHRDPFDRLLLAQAASEGMFLLTADHVLARREGPIKHVV